MPCSTLHEEAPPVTDTRPYKWTPLFILKATAMSNLKSAMEARNLELLTKVGGDAWCHGGMG